MKCQILLSGQYKKNMTNLLSADFAYSMLSVKSHIQNGQALISLCIYTVYFIRTATSEKVQCNITCTQQRLSTYIKSDQSALWTAKDPKHPQEDSKDCLFVCLFVEVLQRSQPNGVMSSAVSLPYHTFLREQA